MARSRTLPAILAFLFALHASGLGEGAILCVSPDGHVSLEAKGAPCCGPGEGSAAPVEISIAAAASIAGCGACTDIPLADAEASASVLAESKQGLPAPSSFLALAPASLSADVPCGRLAAGEPAAGRGTLTHLRSVVLRL